MSTTETTLPCETWIRRYADFMLKGHRTHPGTGFDADDLAQIGRLAAWQAKPDGQGNDDHYRMWKAKGAMLDAIRLGGRQRNLDKGILYTGPSIEDDDLEWISDNRDFADFAMLAYHRGEINRALGRLTPRQREYVELRFYRGYRKPEIIDHFGYDASLSVWRHARRKLAIELAHLRDAF